MPGLRLAYSRVESRGRARPWPPVCAPIPAPMGDLATSEHTKRFCNGTFYGAMEQFIDTPPSSETSELFCRSGRLLSLGVGVGVFIQSPPSSET